MGSGREQEASKNLGVQPKGLEDATLGQREMIVLLPLAFIP